MPTMTRTFHYAYCGRTETDRVCTVCCTIVLGATCQHCARIEQKRATRFAEFLATRKEARA